jgi:hypothetical protein
MRYTLLSDGSSDRALVPILDWTIRRWSREPFTPQWADLACLRQPPTKLVDRIKVAVEYYPCDLLFVHRDAEKIDLKRRIVEIRRAMSDGSRPPAICVVPVRMLEAWLLIEEGAIRWASGNVQGQMDLALPRLGRIEALSDPKTTLDVALRTASGLRGRHLRKLNVRARVVDVASGIQDFTPLLELPAFRVFEEDLRNVFRREGWLAG